MNEETDEKWKQEITSFIRSNTGRLYSTHKIRIGELDVHIISRTSFTVDVRLMTGDYEAGNYKCEWPMNAFKIRDTVFFFIERSLVRFQKMKNFMLDLGFRESEAHPMAEYFLQTGGRKIIFLFHFVSNYEINTQAGIQMEDSGKCVKIKTKESYLANTQWFVQQYVKEIADEEGFEFFSKLPDPLRNNITTMVF